MNFAELFASYWWIIFPIFGMGMGLFGMVDSSRRTRQMMDLMKTYAEQGKDPPAELVAALKTQMQYNNEGSSGPDRWWPPLIFTALAAGFAVPTWYSQAEDHHWAFLMITVLFAILAVGSLLIALFTRPKD